MATKTTHHELVELRLGEDLAAYVRRKREQGRSWRLIARDIENTTGIDLAGETLRSWFESGA